MYPHDYYDHHGPHGHPHLHNRGEGRPYLENDYHANDHGPQLPGLSTIGRGPRGEGLYVDDVVETDSESSFALYSDLTGRRVWQSPNLTPGVIEFIPTGAGQVVAGSPAPLSIKHTRAKSSKTTIAYLPPGEQGSRIYTIVGSINHNPNCVYSIPVTDLVTYGHGYDNAPTPRINDVVMFAMNANGTTKLAIGNIVSIVGGEATFVSRTEVI